MPDGEEGNREAIFANIIDCREGGKRKRGGRPGFPALSARQRRMRTRSRQKQAAARDFLPSFFNWSTRWRKKKERAREPLVCGVVSARTGDDTTLTAVLDLYARKSRARKKKKGGKKRLFCGSGVLGNRTAWLGLSLVLGRPSVKKGKGKKSNSFPTAVSEGKRTRDRSFGSLITCREKRKKRSGRLAGPFPRNREHAPRAVLMLRGEKKADADPILPSQFAD